MELKITAFKSMIYTFEFINQKLFITTVFRESIVLDQTSFRKKKKHELIKPRINFSSSIIFFSLSSKKKILLLLRNYDFSKKENPLFNFE